MAELGLGRREGEMGAGRAPVGEKTFFERGTIFDEIYLRQARYMFSKFSNCSAFAPVRPRPAASQPFQLSHCTLQWHMKRASLCPVGPGGARYFKFAEGAREY
jgi:hypothetical protein